MSPIVHGFDWPDRFVVGTVGRPGSRTFYLQARTRAEIVSVAIEKQQAAALAERIDALLDELMAVEGTSFSIPPTTPDGLADHGPLDEPVDEQFRAGMLRLGWDPSSAQILVEAFPATDDDVDPDDPAAPEPEEILTVRIPVGAARAFAERARDVVGAGRPLCPRCGMPIDVTAADGTAGVANHVCELPDGQR